MLVLAVILAIFVYGMIAATLGTILPNLSERFHLTPAQNGSIAFAQALGLILASLAVGPLLDAEGKKVGMVLGLAFISAALFALPRSRGYKSLLLLLFVLGVGGGIVITGANALASDVGNVHRASMLNMVNLFFGLGGFVTPFIAANLFRKNWIRLCYSIAGFAALTLVLEIATRMPSPAGVHNFVWANIGQVLDRPVVLLLGLFLFLYVSCEVGVWNWLPRHLIAQGIPESRALNILSVGFALGLLVGRLLASPILLRVSRDYACPYRFDGDGGNDVPDAEDKTACDCSGPRGVGRPIHGSGFPDGPGDRGGCISAHDQHGHRLCDYMRMAGARGKLPHHWNDCRRRPSAAAESIDRNPDCICADGYLKYCHPHSAACLSKQHCSGKRSKQLRPFRLRT